MGRAPLDRGHGGVGVAAARTALRVGGGLLRQPAQRVPHEGLRGAAAGRLRIARPRGRVSRARAARGRARAGTTGARGGDAPAAGGRGGIPDGKARG